jgi:hypothetical protein
MVTACLLMGANLGAQEPLQSLLLPPPLHLRLPLLPEPMVVAEPSSLVQLARDLPLEHAVVNTGMFTSKLHYDH